jgi:hypothetical protein
MFVFWGSDAESIDQSTHKVKQSAAKKQKKMLLVTTGVPVPKITGTARVSVFQT